MVMVGVRMSRGAATKSRSKSVNLLSGLEYLGLVRSPTVVGRKEGAVASSPGVNSGSSSTGIIPYLEAIAPLYQ